MWFLCSEHLLSTHLKLKYILAMLQLEYLSRLPSPMLTPHHFPMCKHLHLHEHPVLWWHLSAQLEHGLQEVRHCAVCL